MSFLRHAQIYHPMYIAVHHRERACPPRSRRHRLMSLRPAIPWQVALLQRLPPLRRPSSMVISPSVVVNKKLATTSAGGLLMMLSCAPKKWPVLG